MFTLLFKKVFNKRDTTGDCVELKPNLEVSTPNKEDPIVRTLPLVKVEPGEHDCSVETLVLVKAKRITKIIFFMLKFRKSELIKSKTFGNTNVVLQLNTDLFS